MLHAVLATFAVSFASGYDKGVVSYDLPKQTHSVCAACVGSLVSPSDGSPTGKLEPCFKAVIEACDGKYASGYSFCTHWEAKPAASATMSDVIHVENYKLAWCTHVDEQMQIAHDAVDEQKQIAHDDEEEEENEDQEEDAADDKMQEL